MMKQVFKKSTDEAVNQMLLTAYRRQIPLAWDRAENMQPQCGFGKLSICCSDCHEGPCRVNPFGVEDQQTICGRNQQDLSGGHVLKKIHDGVAAFLKLEADFGLSPDPTVLLGAMRTDDEMLLPDDCAARLVSLGQQTVTALKNIRQLKIETYGVSQPDVAGSNLGALEAGITNIVLHGHVAPSIIAGIQKAADNAVMSVNVVALCGSEIDGGTMPVISNYDSQETVLLTGAVDLLILGNQCVMPSMVKMAHRMGVQFHYASDLLESSDFTGLVNGAQKAFLARSGKPVNIPAVNREVYGGYTVANSPGLFTLLAQGKIKGLVYLGGCGHIASTQDGDFVKQAKDMIAQGYLVVSAGCAGTALAKAGLCHPDYNNSDYPLKGILPSDIPPVLYVGSCHDAGEFISMVQAAGTTPVSAIFSKLAHNKVLATAVGFAAIGINTWLEFDSAFAESVTAGLLGDELFDRVGARVLPLAGLEEITCSMVKAAGGK